MNQERNLNRTSLAKGEKKEKEKKIQTNSKHQQQQQQQAFVKKVWETSPVSTISLTCLHLWTNICFMECISLLRLLSSRLATASFLSRSWTLASSAIFSFISYPVSLGIFPSYTTYLLLHVLFPIYIAGSVWELWKLRIWSFESRQISSRLVYWRIFDLKKTSGITTKKCVG